MKSNYPTFSILLLSLLFAFTSCDARQNDSSTATEVSAPKTPLTMAAFMGDKKTVEAHIEAKTDLNQIDDYGSSSLHIASTFGKTDVAELLIEAGADLNARSADGSTVLHTAAFFGRVDIVNMLIENGADLTLKNDFGATALQASQAPFENLKPIYDQIGRDLGPLGLKLDHDYLKKALPEIAKAIQTAL